MTTRIAALALIAGLAGSFALAQTQQQPGTTRPPVAQPPSTRTPNAQPPKGELPAIPGMSEEDMKACMEAGTPGPQHEVLARNIGTWTANCKMLTPDGATAMESKGQAVYSSFLDGRFIKCDVTGDMGGTPMQGMGLYGYDNVGKTFQATWVMSCGTGMMMGKGEASPDNKTFTWTYDYNCPLNKKLVKMRDVEKHPDANTITIETYGPDPKTGKEVKMGEMKLTRVGGAPTRSGY